MLRPGIRNSWSRTKHDVLLVPHVPAVCAAGGDLLAESAAAPGRHPWPDGTLHHLPAGPAHHVHLQPVSWASGLTTLTALKLLIGLQRSPPACDLSDITHWRGRRLTRRPSRLRTLARAVPGGGGGGRPRFITTRRRFLRACSDIFSAYFLKTVPSNPSSGYNEVKSPYTSQKVYDCTVTKFFEGSILKLQDITMASVSKNQYLGILIFLPKVKSILLPSHYKAKGNIQMSFFLNVVRLESFQVYQYLFMATIDDPSAIWSLRPNDHLLGSFWVIWCNTDGFLLLLIEKS